MALARHWCFTINNPCSTDDPSILLEGLYKYLVWGEETGESGTPHYQGYVQLKVPMRLTALSKKATHAHWEPARGTPEQASQYCKKDGHYTEIGELQTQGKRNDLADAMKSMREERLTKLELMERHPTVCARYGHFVDEYRSALLPERHWKMQVYVYTGPTGSGKSRTAEDKYPDAYWKPDSTKWWPGYEGQEVVIWDDFDYRQVPWRMLLRLLDRYPMDVEVKGGYMRFCSKVIVLTSIDDPSSWYPDENHDFRHMQLDRRITRLVRFPLKK